MESIGTIPSLLWLLVMEIWAKNTDFLKIIDFFLYFCLSIAQPSGLDFFSECILICKMPFGIDWDHPQPSTIISFLRYKPKCAYFLLILTIFGPFSIYEAQSRGQIFFQKIYSNVKLNFKSIGTNPSSLRLFVLKLWPKNWAWVIFSQIFFIFAVFLHSFSLIAQK